MSSTTASGCLGLPRAPPHLTLQPSRTTTWRCARGRGPRNASAPPPRRGAPGERWGALSPSPGARGPWAGRGAGAGAGPGPLHVAPDRAQLLFSTGWQVTPGGSWQRKGAARVRAGGRGGNWAPTADRLVKFPLDPPTRPSATNRPSPAPRLNPPPEAPLKSEVPLTGESLRGEGGNGAGGAALAERRAAPGPHPRPHAVRPAPAPPAPAPRPRGAEGGCWPGAPPPSGMHASELHSPPTPPGGRARPAGVLALRLQLMMLPCSVPTRNLDGPATASYSIATAHGPSSSPSP